MTDTTITAADAVQTITAPGIFSSPQVLQAFSSDKAFTTAQQTQAEVRMSVDGKLTAGYTPMPVEQVIHLQADSPSVSIFKTISQYQKANKTIVYLSGTLSLNATGESFAQTKGVLKELNPMKSTTKVLEPLDYAITWESVDPAVL